MSTYASAAYSFLPNESPNECWGRVETSCRVIAWICGFFLFAFKLWMTLFIFNKSKSQKGALDLFHWCHQIIWARGHVRSGGGGVFPLLTGRSVLTSGAWRTRGKRQDRAACPLLRVPPNPGSIRCPFCQDGAMEDSRGSSGGPVGREIQKQPNFCKVLKLVNSERFVPFTWNNVSLIISAK